MSRKEISEIGREMLAFQEQLAQERHYAPVPPDLFVGDVREKYLAALPSWCQLDGERDAPLLTLSGTQLCTGYNRIVIGDYGAFVEITNQQMLHRNIQVMRGQEYRYQDPRFSAHVKYFWFTARDDSQCKIYLQERPVEYADYVPGMYYISPYEVELVSKGVQRKERP